MSCIRHKKHFTSNSFSRVQKTQNISSSDSSVLRPAPVHTQAVVDDARMSPYRFYMCVIEFSLSSMRSVSNLFTVNLAVGVCMR